MFSNLFSKRGVSILATAAGIALGLTLGMSPRMTAQDKQEKKKDWKDKQEYDLYDAFQKATSPANKLTALEKWKQAYPGSDFADERQEVFLQTYQALMDWRNVIATADEIRKTKPNHFQALAATLDALQNLNKAKPLPPADLDLWQKTAVYMADNLDAICAPDNKPTNLKAEDWAKVKPQMKPFLLQTQLTVIAARKDDSRAVTDLTALLKKDPTQATVSYALATAILAVAKDQKKPEEQPGALYNWARAAAYDGPGSYPAADRQKLMTSLNTAYKAYHGSADGLDQLVATAKANPFPPADFKILSTVDVAEAQAKAEAEADAKDPMKTLWVKQLKDLILMDDTFFDAHVKDAELPGGANGVMKFKGKIVSMTPATRPKEIELAVEKTGVADAKLTFEKALPGKMETGEELQFSGIAQSYTKAPYEVTFAVDAKDLDGWTGKDAVKKAAPKGGATKKAAPKQ